MAQLLVSNHSQVVLGQETDSWGGGGVSRPTSMINQQHLQVPTYWGLVFPANKKQDALWDIPLPCYVLLAFNTTKNFLHVQLDLFKAKSSPHVFSVDEAPDCWKRNIEILIWLNTHDAPQ